jgi:hypothetical protein
VSEANALLAQRWFELMNESARSRVFPEPEVLPGVRRLIAGYHLCEEGSGRMMSVTVWASEAAMETPAKGPCALVSIA